MSASGRDVRWGWHRLSGRWAEILVADAQVTPGTLVVDIGAGTGAVTAALVAAGAHVVAVELHPGRAAHLRRRFAGQPVTVVRADATTLRLPRRPFRVVSNPPFSATTAILRRLLAPGSRLVAADLVLPAWAARRWAAGRAPGAGRWARQYAADVGRPVPQVAFTPPAPTPSRVLVIRGRSPT
ncbi:MAG TPA: rRNA adenine N-6-methyltransferase family protein [Acidimicrobiales bacterium]